MALRAVGEGEKPAAKKPQKSVTEAASKGSQRELLVAMRDRIAQAVEDSKTSPRDLAALTRRLLELTRDIEQIDARDQQEEARASGEVGDAPFDASAI